MMNRNQIVENEISKLDMPARVLYAYQIYLTNHSVTKTAKIVGVDRTTIYRWKQIYEWDKLQEAAFQSIMKASEEHRNQIQETQREIINEIVAKIEEDIENGKLEIKTINELIAIFKYQLELEGEKFTNSTVEINMGFDISSLYGEIMKRRELSGRKKGRDQ